MNINDLTGKYYFTSYPIEVKLNLSLFDHPDFSNRAASVSMYTYLNAMFSQTQQSNFLDTTEDKNLYRYQVIQWGDEDVLLTDDDILDSEFFKIYDSDNEIIEDDFYYKRHLNNTKSLAKDIEEYSYHVYNTPGIKNIKIVVYRYNIKDNILFQTTLVTKNIVVNSGTLLSQDFSILGGTNFNFLPLKKENQVIIGGMDEDSKYNNSVEKIVKDDNFIQEDYLERNSCIDFIGHMSMSLYGEHLGQVDLGINRVFKGSHDIYNFLNLKSNEMNQIIESGFPSFDNDFYIKRDDWSSFPDDEQAISIETSKLEINSEATNIFINDNKTSSLISDCLVELVPSEMEYLTIPNEIGTDAKAILIGDYEVKQPKDGKINKKGIMKTSMLEKNRDKQAF